MLVIALSYFYKQASVQPKWMQSIHIHIQQLMLHFLKTNKLTGYFLLGMANGLLPCGMVYLAIAGAVTANTVRNSVLFMFLFGVGTLPAMLVLGIFGLRITMPVRQQMKPPCHMW